MKTNVDQVWWKFGHVWLVIAGPLVVVVASFVTLYLAIRTPDPVIRDEASYSAAPGTKGRQTMPGGLAPAEKARNHAATGTVPVPNEKP